MANGSNLRSVRDDRHAAVQGQPLRNHAAFDLAERCIRAGSRTGDTVLDPFSGAGTTALVADRLGRSAIGIELNPEYAAMGSERVRADAPLFTDVTHV